VHVALTEEQAMLVATVHDMVAGAGVVNPRAGDAVDTDIALWDALVDAGFVGMRTDGVSAVEVALVAEELARGACAVPFVGTAIADELFRAADAPPSHSSALLVSGDLLTISGDGVAWDAPAPQSIAVGLDADRVVVGESGELLDAVDLTRRVCGEARGDEPVGAPLTRAQAARAHAFALALLAADLVGSMHGALDAAVAHDKERVQFGRPVGSFQAVQHLGADALVLVESARSVMWHAAWAVDELDAADALLAARVAKAYCAEAAPRVCETAIQMWGGIGMTWECRAHLFLRRALLSRQVLGDEHVQLAAIAEARLGAGVA
jgi:alkylation response protein AidB-like acyl-CoA dehydrogenase